MNDPTPNIDPKNKGRAMYDEADIGSGERSPGQHETDEMIRGIPSLPANRQADEGRQREDSQAPQGGQEDTKSRNQDTEGGDETTKGDNEDTKGGGGEPPANRQGTPGV